MHLLPGWCIGVLVFTDANIMSAAASSSLTSSQVADRRWDGPGELGSKVLRLKAESKDGPIDGQDGKPHAGPFVESTKKKMSQQVMDLSADTADAIMHGLGEQDHGREDSVMADVTNHKQVSGVTGVEDGVSQKTREREAKGESAGKIPERPKEAPRLPETLQTSKSAPRTDQGAATENTKPKGAAGLEKPSNLPDIPVFFSQPEPLSSSGSATGTQQSSSTLLDDTLLHPLHSFFLAFTMIIFSEIGDKTFLVAALMAMRHARMVVFSAAFAALALMTVLSALLGHAFPALLPKRITSLAAAMLFFVFGFRLLREGLAMSPDEGVGQEMKEVEMEMEEKEAQMRSARGLAMSSPYMLESGRAGRLVSPKLSAPARSPSSSPAPAIPPSPSSTGSFASLLYGLNNLSSLLLSEAWTQTFVMTFLGEWGDRSQIATIAMAAGQDYWWVSGGAIIGHAACTALAVLGGRAVAGRVSMRIVTLGGAISFLVFGAIYLAEAIFFP